jgi:adenylylsulfate reductase subunit A
VSQLPWPARVADIKTGVLIIGGGTAGCAAARRLAELGERDILVLEKASVKRSGCLSAGVNALNAWVGPGASPRDYADYALNDAHGIGDARLLLSMSEGLNGAVEFLASLGLKIHRDSKGAYLSRSWRNLKVNGENVKPLLAGAIRGFPGLKVRERVHVFALTLSRGPDRRIAGALAMDLLSGDILKIRAPKVLLATGGAAGIYAPNAPGSMSHRLWYPPFNVGGGYAMGIRAGAEMTSLEMRFVALRCQDTQAPTGTLALGGGARQLNALGEDFAEKYGNTTSQRVLANRRERERGLGPIRLEAPEAGEGERERALRAYFNMAPQQPLKWLEEERLALGRGERIPPLGAEVEGSEPFLVGGHASCGFYVDPRRETSLPGLYAAGDVAGGCPQKYVTGAISEAFIAATAIASSAAEGPEEDGELAREYLEAALSGGAPGARPSWDRAELEEAAQRAMDLYAGGRGAGYRYSQKGLATALSRIAEIAGMAASLKAVSPKELSLAWELRERLTVAQALVGHLRERRETRWPGFGEYGDFPLEDPGLALFVNSRRLAVGPEKDGKTGEFEFIFRDLESGERLPAPGTEGGAGR